MSTFFLALLTLAAAATKLTQAYVDPDIQMRMGLPGMNHLEVLSNERNNSTIQAFLDEYLSDTGFECHYGFVGDAFATNVEALQECLKNPDIEGFFWWFSKKFKLHGDASLKRGNLENCEILVKSVQFLQDGHVIFCLSTYEKVGDFVRKKEKDLLEALKKCVKSQLGYIGGSGSPPVSSLAEFMVQMEEHEKHGHWMLRMGTYEGEEMTAGQFVREVLIGYEERYGKQAENVSIGWTDTAIKMFCDEHEFHFHFKEKIERGGGEHKYFSTSFDVDGE